MPLIILCLGSYCLILFCLFCLAVPLYILSLYSLTSTTFIEHWCFLKPCLWYSIRSLSQGSTNSNLLDMQTGHKKRVQRSSLLNGKKLYEDAQMARKVRQYLSQLQVESDEEKLQIMSLQCEPAYSTRKIKHSLIFTV